MGAVMPGIEFKLDCASDLQLMENLQACDNQFIPPLSARVDISAYVLKICNHATRFEAWSGGRLVGFVAAYLGDNADRFAHITNVSVLPEFAGRGLAATLLRHCVERAQQIGLVSISLDVAAGHDVARRLYSRAGFSTLNPQASILTMRLFLQDSDSMSNQRDYDVEIQDNLARRYAYGFDFDVMHPYMIQSFEPFFRPGNLLELGSFKGDFTRRFLPYFSDVTCVEASDAALGEARARLGDQAQWVHAMFETVTLPKRYDNIVLTHVLEHLDDPVQVLRRINDEWLAEGGRFFLVCPNANAPSRQIAVKMGLISHNAAVTPAEADHGHRCTYTLDTLERDAVQAGLRVVHRSGIFFKALANFQWDRLLQTDIISKEYLDGCYKLGQQYPDLCSSIFLLCERGEPGR